jgi:hypothetical protein
MGKETLGYRLEGIRVGGAAQSDGLLSDYCGLCLWLMVIHFLRAKHPFARTFWLGISAVSLLVILATGNRGGVLSLGTAFAYSLWVFRRYMNPMRYVLLFCSVVVVFATAQFLLEEYTIAVSVIDRLAETRFKGLEPETRVGVWGPVFQRSLDHIFIGHGPWYAPVRGVARMFWPHNGYLFYLYTLGLFGLSVFLVIVYKLFRTSLRYAHPLASGTFLGTALSVFGVQLVQLVVAQMGTDHQRSTDFIYMYIIWLLFGLIAAAGNMVRQREISAAGEPVLPDSSGTLTQKPSRPKTGGGRGEG